MKTISKTTNNNNNNNSNKRKINYNSNTLFEFDEFDKNNFILHFDISNEGKMIDITNFIRGNCKCTKTN